MSQSSVRNLVVALIFFTAVVGFAVFTFVNLLNNSHTLEKQIAVVAAQNQQEANMIRLQKIALNSEEERATLASYFLFRESDTINFLNEIETEVAPNLGIQLETNDLRQVNEDGKDWIEISFEISGDRKNLQNFIKILESVPFSSRISRIDMSGNRPDFWRADIIIQVQLLSYD